MSAHVYAAVHLEGYHLSMEAAIYIYNIYMYIYGYICSYNLAVRGIHLLLFIEKWITSIQFVVLTHAKRLIIGYS